LLRKALHIDVGNSQAKSMLEKVTVELRRTEILPRLQEHLSKGEGYLQAGQLREAKAEAQAALGLDSKHEPAKKLLGDVEAAEAKAQQLEQRLRLTKQRLAEGALTEAAAALGQALELDGGSAPAQELKKQIEEERNRREKRKKLAEVIHRARTLWTELNYEECLSVLAAALQEFPNEPELKKLQETARADQAEQAKLRQIAEVRKLLGQQKIAEAAKGLEALVKDYPQDTAVRNLQNLISQEQRDQQRQNRLETEITALRGLLGAGKFKQVVAKGEPLLEEFPQDYELRELLNFARGEVTQLEQKRKEEEREKQIQGFLLCERYGEALDVAQKAVQEFPAHDGFRKLAAEAEALKKEQDDRERARVEMQRRVREINSKINQDKITDAIEMAQQTMETLGPDPNVTQLLQGAEEKKRKKEQQEQKVAALQTMVDRGDQAGATKLFKEVMATQIFQSSDPRMQELRSKIDSLTPVKPTSGTQLYPAAKPPAAKPPAPPAPEKPQAAKPAPPPPRSSDATQLLGSAPPSNSGTVFSATRVMGPETPPVPRREPPVAKRPDAASGERPGRRTEVPEATVIASSSGRPAASATVVEPRPRETSTVSASGTTPAAKPKPAAAAVPAMLRQPAVLGGIAAGVLVVLVAAVWIIRGISASASGKELKLKQQAEQLWQDRQFDQAEQTWRQLAAAKGALQKEASGQVAQIEQKRAQDQQQFDAGMALLTDKKDCVGAQQAFQSVVDANLWHAEEGAHELSEAKACASALDVHKQEQDQFDQGVKLFQANDLEGARKAFRAMLDLNVAGSTLKPQAENYLTKIRQTGNDEKIYAAAMQDLKDEKFAEARDGFQDLVKRKGPKSADAKKQLTSVETALNTVNGVGNLIRSGSFRAAKAQLDSTAQWSKTHDRLAGELRGTEQQQFESLRSYAQSVEGKGDLQGIQRAIDDLHGFEGRAEDSVILASCKDIEKKLNAAYTAASEKVGDKAAFDAAVLRFNQAQQKKDIDGLTKLIPEFQKIASGNGIYRVAASQYVSSTIPSAIQVLRQTAGKVVVPALTCGPGAGGADVPSVGGTVSCAQLDANPTLQWVGVATVDFPDEAKQPGKLPYTLTVLVTVEPNGNVKVDKDGNPDKDFFKKVKDASKHWKATEPKSKGKPVSVRFPLTITFQR